MVKSGYKEPCHVGHLPNTKVSRRNVGEHVAGLAKPSLRKNRLKESVFWTVFQS